MNHRIKVTTNRFLRYTQNGVYVPCTFVDEKREKDEYEWMFLVDKTKPLKIGTDIQQSLFNLEQLIKSRKDKSPLAFIIKRVDALARKLRYPYYTLEENLDGEIVIIEGFEGDYLLSRVKPRFFGKIKKQ